MLVQQLQHLEAELHHPGRPCTRERLEQLLHPQFHEVGRSGRPYSRQTVIDYLVGVRKPGPVCAADYQAHLLAHGVALLTYQSYEPGPDSVRQRITYRSSIWRRDGLEWQLFYHQGTPANP